MAQPVTDDIQAQHAARMIKLFRDRKRTLDLERECIDAMIDDLTRRLLRYRQSVRLEERHGRHAALDAQEKISDG